MRAHGICVLATLVLASPALVFEAAAQVRRGGGGGGASIGCGPFVGNAGISGSPGTYVEALVPVTPGSSYPVTVGIGGTGGVGGAGSSCVGTNGSAGNGGDASDFGTLTSAAGGSAVRGIERGQGAAAAPFMRP